MRLVFPKGDAYETTPDDRLWLLRAVEVEGPSRTMVARALVNGFALSRARGGATSLATYVRAYAQPVNPRWFPEGDLFLRYNNPPTSEALTAAKRRRDIHSTRTDFDAETEEAVTQALSTPFVSDVTDYAAPTLDATKKGMVARSEPRSGINRLWTRSPGWPGYAIDDGDRTFDVFAALALLGLAVALARGMRL